MSRGLAFRRAQEYRAQAHARHIIHIWGHRSHVDDYLHPGPSLAWFGLMVSTHCRPCSCSLCNPYAWGNSIRDLREKETLHEALEYYQD